MIPKRYIRMFLSWLGLIFRKISRRSYRVLHPVFRLFQCYQDACACGGKSFREGGLALSSQPASASETKTFAVPITPQLSEGCAQSPTPKLAEGSAVVTSNTQASQVPITTPSSITMPVPFTSPQLHPAVLGQSSKKLTPIIPRQVKRYERKSPITGNHSVFVVEQGPLDCSEEDNATEYPWQSLTHPEGALFFYHPFQRLFTDADIGNHEIAGEVNRAAEMAYAAAHSAGIHLDGSHAELVLELMDDKFGYYFADHAKHVIFWFESHKSRDLMNNVRGVERKSHVRYALEAQYWEHIELYPNKRSLPKDTVEKLNEMIMHALAENITSGLCLPPFSSDEVAGMLTLMDPLTKSINKEREHSVWIVARFMRLLCNAKFVNFCGQPGARLQADQSLYVDPNAPRKSVILRVMNVVLFGSPDAKSKAVHRIWVDDTIVQPRWRDLINKLNSEWNGYTIFSTVMLAVDISFLAVPSVQTQTAAILIAYLSTFCALGSLLVSLVLAGQVNDTRRDNAKDVASFMLQMSRSMLGLEGLALMLSLPFALLIWGMMFFGAALSIVVFRTSTTVAITIAALIWAAVIVLAAWPVMAANNIHLTSLRRWALERIVYGATGDEREPPG